MPATSRGSTTDLEAEAKGTNKLPALNRRWLVGGCMVLLCFTFHFLGNFVRGYVSVIFATEDQLGSIMYLAESEDSFHLQMDKNHSLLYRYTWNNRKGHLFKVDREALSSIGFPLSNFVSLTDTHTLENFVFVTAASEHFIDNSAESISTIQEHFPEKKIIFFDLGISEDSIQKVKSMCNVEYRVFNFTKFPRYIKANLKNYSWKLPIIHVRTLNFCEWKNIYRKDLLLGFFREFLVDEGDLVERLAYMGYKEVMAEYPGVFWVDASIRFTGSDMTTAFSKVRQTGGLSLFIYTGHSNYAVTLKETVNFLPTDPDKQKNTIQSGCTIMLVYRTQAVYENILKWGVLCSLEEDCMAHGLVDCYFWGKGTWAGCSRFDQTAVNILCSNYYGFDNLKYTAGNRLHNIQEIFQVRRFSQGHKHPAYCNENNLPQIPSWSSTILRVFLELP